MAKIECLQGAIRRLIARREALREYDCGPDLEANRLELASRQRLSHALIDRYLCRVEPDAA